MICIVNIIATRDDLVCAALGHSENVQKRSAFTPVFVVFKHVYPDMSIKWKRHVALHLCKQIEKHVLLADVLPMERKISAAKGAVTNSKSKVSFEETGLVRYNRHVCSVGVH